MFHFKTLERQNIIGTCFDKHWVMGFSPFKVPILPMRHDLKFDVWKMLSSTSPLLPTFPSSLRKILELRRFTEANAATLGSQMLVSWRSWCLTASQPACPPNATPSAIKGLDQAFFRRNYWFIINALNKASFYFRGKLCWGDRFMAGHFEGWEGEMFSLFRDMLSFRSCF